MEGIKSFLHLKVAMFVALLLLFRPVVDAQQTSSFCSSSMLNSFNSCINYLSSGSGSSPTSECCDSLKSLMSSGRDCLCLIITGGIALSIPINRTLAASLPRACKKSGVPIECKALPGAPIPAPGPAALNAPPPPWLPYQSPQALTPPALTPPGNAAPGEGADGTTVTPPVLTPDTDVFPSMTPPGIRPDLSTAGPSPRFSHLSLIALLGAIAFKYF